ncbi:hypothetical protein SLA2020_192730 [Shorea laevis]
MGSKYIHDLKQLEVDQCLSIITQRAFGEDAVPLNLKEVGFGIDEKCGGVPLVANVIHGTLYNRRDENEWLSVCSAIEKEKLIQLWMAEGYLQSSKESSMEDVGAQYFTDLLSYSLFQEEAGAFGDACKIHDLIHDCAQSIYAEAVIIDKSFGKEKGQIKLEDVAEKLQTLFLEQGFPASLQGNFKRLRVLSVSGANEGEPSPSCFGNLKSLRYLDISGTSIRQLPKFITKMYHLQIFRFNSCKSLKMPPEGIGHLIELRHIYFDDEDRMPAHIGRLTSLQTLQKFFVGEKRGHKIEELGKLSQLRGRLEIYNLERVKDKSEAQRAGLKEKAVDKLEFSWGKGSNHDKDVLEGLLPPYNLQILGILGYGGGELPSWMLESHSDLFLLKNLVKLNIERCQNLEEIEIPLLERFSSLRRLYIEQCSKLSNIKDEAIEFTPLEELSIQHCGQLKSVLVYALTSLQTLEICFCKVLNSIGDSLSTSKCLKGLRLSSCHNLESVPSLEGLTSLKRLEIVHCHELMDLPNGLSSCTAPEELAIRSCKNLLSIPEELKELRSLVKLEISRCQKLRSFPKESLGYLNRLKRLSIGSFSEEMEKFPDLSAINASLEELTLRNWRTKELFELPQLKILTISNCDNLISLPPDLKELRSLVELKISYCPKLSSFPGDKPRQLPDQIQHLTALKKLTILGFVRVVALPEWVGNFSSLQLLQISLCDNMKHLPSAAAIRRLSKLQRLEIFACPKLGERCAKKRGSEWSKISDIPEVNCY